MTDKLTDTEIKKALEDMVECNADKTKSCNDCVLNKHYPYCEKVSFELALDLINRLEGEKEKNENIIRVADKTIATLNAENESLKAEVERLKEEVKKEQLYNLRMTAYSVKAEAYKECIDKAKLQCNKIPQYHFNLLNVEWYLDNLLNELVGDGDA
jgi:predicted RNase H-like nuclease (RuvC/YqgF family)